MAIQLNSGYQIVIPVNSGVSGEYAASELARYLQKITGTDFPVITDDSPEKAKEILIGKTNRLGTPNGAGLKNDGYVVRTFGEKLFIYGENARADLYGIYYFLETYLDCGFYSSNLEKVPYQPDVCLPEIDDKRVSPLEYRSTSWYEPLHSAEFSMKRGFNNICRDEKYGGCMRIDSLCHTTFNYIHPDEYFDTHPEYFSMIDGKRIRELPQLCLSNPDVLAITIKKLRQKIKEHPEIKMFGISQMDWYNPCQCPECSRIDAEEGSQMGTTLRFINAIAEDIEKDYPDIIIETLAYQYTRQPPKITKPRHNVCICLCTIECCFTHPMRECSHIAVPFKNRVIPGATVPKDLKEWGKICKRMFIWDYTTNFRFYLTPNINLHVLQDNLNFFLENGATSIYEQGNGWSISGEFGELRAYIISKLFWEPHGDVSAWMDEFLAGYYGKEAAKPIRAYIDYLTDYVTQYNVHAGIYDNPQDVIPDVMIPVLDKFWDEAEAAAEDAAALTRIQRSRLQLRFVKLHRKAHIDVDYKETVESFIDDVKRHNITYIQEARPIETSFAQLRSGYLPDSGRSFWDPQP